MGVLKPFGGAGRGSREKVGQPRMQSLEAYAKDIQEAVCATDVRIDEKTVSGDEAVAHVVSLLRKTEDSGGKVFIIGNGGSAGIASHTAIDLLKVVGVPAMTLTDGAQLTCLANDIGYELVYSIPIEKLGHSSDVLIAISSSGKSQNIQNGIGAAQAKKMTVITFTGFASDNPIRTLGDISFYTNAESYGVVELAHQVILHAVIDQAQEVLLKE